MTQVRSLSYLPRYMQKLIVVISVMVTLFEVIDINSLVYSTIQPHCLMGIKLETDTNCRPVQKHRLIITRAFITHKRLLHPNAVFK